MATIFDRNILFWGPATQARLRAAHVLVAGLGGLGGLLAQLLVRAGVGTLTLIDYQRIDPPDLNRQVLYGLDDLGAAKTSVAAERLRRMTGATAIEAVTLRIGEDADALRALLARVDGVADCLDNFASRFALDATLPKTVFMVHGAVARDYGQVTTVIPDTTPRLRDIYGANADSEYPIPVCPNAIAVICGLMATEVIYNLTGQPRLAGVMLVAELSDFSLFKIKLGAV